MALEDGALAHLIEVLDEVVSSIGVISVDETEPHAEGDRLARTASPNANDLSFFRVTFIALGEVSDSVEIVAFVVKDFAFHLRRRPLRLEVEDGHSLYGSVLPAAVSILYFCSHSEACFLKFSEPMSRKFCSARLMAQKQS